MTKIITIDGPSASGKSSVASLVAYRLGFRYLNSGSLYRYLAYLWDKQKISYDEGMDLSNVGLSLSLEFVTDDSGWKVYDMGKDVSDIVQSDVISARASELAVYPEVRSFLLDRLRSYATDCQGLVTDGRDMGSVVFPDATIKLYLTASALERAKRRLKQEHLDEAQLPIIEQDIKKRDQRDMLRKQAPLKQSADAVLIDTSDKTLNDVVHDICELSRKLDK